MSDLLLLWLPFCITDVSAYINCASMLIGAEFAIQLDCVQFQASYAAVRLVCSQVMQQ